MKRTVTKVEEERRDDFGLLTGHIEAMRSGHGARLGRGRQAGQRAAQRAQGARPLGRAAASQRARKLRPDRALRFRDRGQPVGRRGRAAAARRHRPRARRAEPGDRRQGSLNAYQDAFGAVDEAERATAPRCPCRGDQGPRQHARQQGLLGAVRRCARLCRDVHPRRAFPVGRAGAGSRSCGTMRSTGGCCSRPRPT